MIDEKMTDDYITVKDLFNISILSLFFGIILYMCFSVYNSHYLPNIIYNSPFILAFILAFFIILSGFIIFFILALILCIWDLIKDIKIMRW